MVQIRTMNLIGSFPERGESPPLTYTPPSLVKGRGSGGWVTKQHQNMQFRVSLTCAIIQIYENPRH
jgi:hypothetical protein